MRRGNNSKQLVSSHLQMQSREKGMQKISLYDVKYNTRICLYTDFQYYIGVFFFILFKRNTPNIYYSHEYKRRAQSANSVFFCDIRYKSSKLSQNKQILIVGTIYIRFRPKACIHICEGI